MIRPTDAPPPLAGLGIHARAFTKAADGTRRLQVAEDVWLVDDGRNYYAEVDYLPAPVPLDREQVVKAAAQWVNVVLAAVHEADAATRSAAARHVVEVLDEAIEVCIAETRPDGRGEL